MISAGAIKYKSIIILPKRFLSLPLVHIFFQSQGRIDTDLLNVYLFPLMFQLMGIYLPNILSLEVESSWVYVIVEIMTNKIMITIKKQVW